MVINIPDDIKKSFFDILNLAQGSFTSEEEEGFTEEEKKCLKFIRKLLGDKAYTPFTSKKEMWTINKDFQRSEQ